MDARNQDPPPAAARAGSVLLLAMLWVHAVTAHAADHIVDSDRTVDFAALSTFSLHDSAIGLDRPELNSPLVESALHEAIRTTLVARGLAESGQGADMTVDWSVNGQRFAINEWGHAIPLDEMRGGARIPPGNPWMGLPAAFVEAVLVVDLKARPSGQLVWRGVIRTRESDVAKLAQRLPGYAQKLLGEYPPRGRVEPGVTHAFVVRPGQINSEKPEIDNRLFMQRMEDSIRAALAKKKFMQTATDLQVTWHFQDRNVNAVSRQPAARIPDNAFSRGFVIPATGPNPLLYTEGTLVIDVTDESGTLLWRGVRRNQEASGPSLSRKLPQDAARLLSGFRPTKRATIQ